MSLGLYILEYSILGAALLSAVYDDKKTTNEMKILGLVFFRDQPQYFLLSCLCFERYPGVMINFISWLLFSKDFVPYIIIQYDSQYRYKNP